MADAAKKSLDDAFLEVIPRVGRNDLFAKRARELSQPPSQHVETNPGVQKRNFGAHVLCDAGSGVERDCLPCRLSLFLWNLMCK